MGTGLTGEPPLSRGARMDILLPFALCTLIWGATWIVIRGQLGIVPPAWSIAYRFLIGSAVMFAYARVRRDPLRLDRRGVAIVLAVGCTQFMLNFNFVYHAAEYVSSGLIALIFALLVVCNALLAWIFMRQGISRPFLAGAAVALAGQVLLFSHEIDSSAIGGATLLGLGLAFIGMVLASIANVILATRRAQAMPMATLLAWAMLAGAVIDIGWAWISAGPPVFDTRPSYILGLLYLGILASSVAFGLYFGVIGKIGPGRAAYSSVLVPLIAMALSTLFEDYRWSAAAAAGAALTLLGLVISLSAPRPARKSG